MDEGKHNLLIAEDHLLFSEGLKLGLEKSGYFKTIFQAKNGLEAIKICKSEKIDLVLMDIQMPECDGLTAAAQIKKQFPQIKIIMLTSWADSNSVRKAFAAAVEGYCLKEIPLKSLLYIMSLVLQGKIWIDPNIASYLLQSFQQQDIQSSDTASPQIQKPVPEPPSVPALISPSSAGKKPVENSCVMDYLKYSAPELPDPMKVLNARELQILHFIAENKTNQEIVSVLGIGEDWLNGHIQNIVSKLSVSNEIQAVQRALETGMIDRAPILENEMLC